MFVVKERLESLIGWTCNLSDSDLQDPSITEAKINDFKFNHMSYISDPVYDQWKNIRATLPQPAEFEINSNNEIIRTFYWTDKAAMISAETTMSELDDQYIANGGSIPYQLVLIEEYTV